LTLKKITNPVEEEKLSFSLHSCGQPHKLGDCFSIFSAGLNHFHGSEVILSTGFYYKPSDNYLWPVSCCQHKKFFAQPNRLKDFLVLFLQKNDCCK